MQRATRFIYILLKNTFLISAIGLLIGLIGGTESLLGGVFGMIGFYGAILTIKLFFIHVLLVILTYILKNGSSGA